MLKQEEREATLLESSIKVRDGRRTRGTGLAEFRHACRRTPEECDPNPGTHLRIEGGSGEGPKEADVLRDGLSTARARQLNADPTSE